MRKIQFRSSFKDMREENGETFIKSPYIVLVLLCVCVCVCVCMCFFLLRPLLFSSRGGRTCALKEMGTHGWVSAIMFFIGEH